MGLSGRKTKQRIPADPRNLTWADDAAKFGSSYLSKFGWDSSKGLGASGDGRTSHIKVSQKLDMLGIGAAHQKDPDGIAWKQNKDFESLLRRLNEAAAVDGDDVLSTLGDGDNGKAIGKEGGTGETEKKRKRLDDVTERNAKKLRRKDTKDINSKRSKQATAEVTKNTTVAGNDVTVTPAYIPRHRAHRARAIASKNMASKSTAAISEILGIAPSSPTALNSSTPSDKLTSSGDGLTLEVLTTSTKSVADYFRDKLLARSSAKSGTTTPRTEYEAETHDAPRGGLGSSRPNSDMPKLFSSNSSTFCAPTNQSSPHESASDVLSAETQTKSSEDASLVEPSLKSQKKTGEKEKRQKGAKGDKKTRKKERSQASNECC